MTCSGRVGENEARDAFVGTNIGVRLETKHWCVFPCEGVTRVWSRGSPSVGEVGPPDSRGGLRAVREREEKPAHDAFPKKHLEAKFQSAKCCRWVEEDEILEKRPHGVGRRRCFVTPIQDHTLVSPCPPYQAPNPEAVTRSPPDKVPPIPVLQLDLSSGP